MGSDLGTWKYDCCSVSLSGSCLTAFSEIYKMCLWNTNAYWGLWRRKVHSLLFNPFTNTEAFWRFCSKWFFEKSVSNGSIAHQEQFLLLPLCFTLYSIVLLLSFTESCPIFYLMFSSVLLQISCMWERVKLGQNSMARSQYKHFGITINVVYKSLVAHANTAAQANKL